MIVAMSDDDVSSRRPDGRGLSRRRIVQPASAPPSRETINDVLTSKLPRWPLRRSARQALPDAEPGGPRGPAPNLPASGSAGEFTADRRAARYVPPEGVFQIDDRDIAVVTVSMTGVSLRWDGPTLPPIGTALSGELAPGLSVRAFPVTVLVARHDVATRVVGARFGTLTGRAIDRLLEWLWKLDGDAGAQVPNRRQQPRDAGEEPAPR